MSDHPSELRQVPTQREIREGFEAQFREAMAEAMAGVDPARLEAAGDLAGILNQQK